MICVYVEIFVTDGLLLLKIPTIYAIGLSSAKFQQYRQLAPSCRYESEIMLCLLKVLTPPNPSVTLLTLPYVLSPDC